VAGLNPSPLRILHLDEQLVAVYKPAGLLVHRSSIDRSETRFALQETRNLLRRRVYSLHRLDKPTAGILLFALDPDSARRMAAQFASGQIHKRYLAVVRGHLPDRGRIDHPLSEEQDPMTDALADPDKPAQPALTAYRCLARAELLQAVGRYATARYSLLEASPETGRKHQIRRHLKHIFHPVVGDTTHGDGRHNRFFREHFGCHRLLLAATALTCAHPATGASLSIRTRPDEEFGKVLDALGWAGSAVGDECTAGSVGGSIYSSLQP